MIPTYFLLILTLLLIVSPSFGQEHHGSAKAPALDNVQCQPYGVCEPCPEDSLHEPFCQPFGNRRLLRCKSVFEDGTYTPNDHEGETAAWESCGRIPAKERADFWEFVLSNILFAVGAVAIVYFRSNQLAALRARNLAARIGIGSAG